MNRSLNQVYTDKLEFYRNYIHLQIYSAMWHLIIVVIADIYQHDVIKKYIDSLNNN